MKRWSDYTVTELNLLHSIPKVDLHVHLDGCINPHSLVRIAAHQQMSLPAKQAHELIPYIQVGQDCTSLTEYLTKFDFVLPFLQTREALKQVAYDVVQHASEHNIKYIEVRFAPQLHRQYGLSIEETIQYVIQGLHKGEQEFGVMARVIVICMRNHSPKLNREVIEASASFLGKGLVAVDLAGDELHYPAELFREVFAYANDLGIPITIHAGEAAGPDNIEEAVLHLGASRIGHGVRLKDNPRIQQLISDRGIPLELCPTSNIQTKAVASWSEYPIREYYDQGIPITVNTDNPSVSGTNITKEYQILMDKFGFTIREIVKLILNGVEASFLGAEEKASLKKDFEEVFKKLNV